MNQVPAVSPARLLFKMIACHNICCSCNNSSALRLLRRKLQLLLQNWWFEWWLWKQQQQQMKIQQQQQGPKPTTNKRPHLIHTYICRFWKWVTNINIYQHIMQGMTKQQHRYSHSLVVATNNTKNSCPLYDNMRTWGCSRRMYAQIQRLDDW